MDCQGLSHKAYFDGNHQLVAAIAQIRDEVEQPLLTRIRELEELVRRQERLIAIIRSNEPHIN